MGAEVEIMIIASLVAMACALPGVFLVLRKMSLMTDAISHAVLLGIVVGFFITKSLTSPILILAAALTGVLTVTLTELIVKSRKVKEDASIGLVFPLLFSIAVILITRFAKDIHLDTDAVLLGEIAFAPFERFTLWGMDIGPQSLWVMASILVINAIFIVVFYKELKLSTFDAGLAATLGFMPGVLHYVLMAIVSVTVVGAFDVVGSILVVAFVIGPPAAAYLLTDRLPVMIGLSIVIGVASSLLGYGMAYLLDVSIAGSMATMVGVLFLLVLVFAPRRGLLSKILLHKRQRSIFSLHMMLLHIFHHEATAEEQEENHVDTIHEHLNWTKEFTKGLVDLALRNQFVLVEGGILRLTQKGRLIEHYPTTVHEGLSVRGWSYN